MVQGMAMLVCPPLKSRLTYLNNYYGSKTMNPDDFDDLHYGEMLQQPGVGWHKIWYWRSYSPQDEL